MSVSSKKNGCNVAKEVLEHFGISDLKNNENTEDDENNPENEDGDEDEVGKRIYDDNIRRSFKFENTDDVIEAEEIKEIIEEKEIDCVKKISGNFKFETGGNDNIVKITEDIYSSDDLGASVIAGYIATDCYCKKNKKILHHLISFLSIVPKMVLQISWILFVAGIFGNIVANNTVYVWATVITVLSFCISAMNFYYEKYVGENTILTLKELSIINESENKTVKKIINLIAINRTVNCFKLLYWFARRILGYDI